MDFEILTMSYHYETERAERRELMCEICRGNFGEYLCKAKGHSDCWRCMTTMGICFVVDPSLKRIITAYPCSMSQARAICKSAGVHMSNSLQKRIEKNQMRIDKFYSKKVA